MPHNPRCLVGLMLLLACATQDPTSSTVNRDPDLSGRYQSNFNVTVLDSASYPFHSAVLSADCPAKWILSQTRTREYAVTINIVLASCYENRGHITDYLTLAPTITGVLRLNTVGWNTLTSWNLGTLVVGKGTAEEFRGVTGCSPSGIGAGWNIAFQAYTNPDYTFQTGWAQFFPDVPSTRQGEGAFYVLCHGIGGLSIDLAFNGLQAAN